MLDNLSDMVLVLDPTGRVIEVAGNCMGIAGYARDELLQCEPAALWAYLLAPEDLPWLQADLASAAQALTATRRRARIHDRAGEVRWCELTTIPLRDDDDRYLGAQVIVRDIGEQVQSQQIILALNKAAGVVQSAALSVSGVLATTVAELSALGFRPAVLLCHDSPGMAHFARAGDDDLVVEAVRRFVARRQVPPALWFGEGSPLRQALETRRAVRFTMDEDLFLSVLGDAEWAHSLARIVPPVAAIAFPLLADDLVLGLLFVAGERLRESVIPGVEALAHQTAIALRNAELLSRLGESEAQYRGIFEAARDGMLVCDDAGQVVEANPAACAMFGYLHERLVGTGVGALFGEPFALPRFAHEVLVNGHERLEANGIREDGVAFPAHIQGTHLIFRGQRHLLAVVTDITERVKAQEALVRSERLRALGQMAGGIAHDFNNILVGIRGYADMALLDLRERPSALPGDLDRILLGTRDAADAVRRLQSLYRQVEDTSDFLPLQLDTLVAEALALTQPRWKDVPQAAGHTIRVISQPTAPPNVLGNPAELRRVLTNLIVNAIDAMPVGGELTLATGQEGSWSWVRVSDTGVGITPEAQEHLFEPFFTTKRSSGLGLTVSATIVRRHGGEISFESAAGRGTSFTVRLPARPERVATATLAPGGGVRGAPLVSIAGAFRRGCRVLVVDDEQVVRGLLERLLQRLGQTVVAVASGREALALLKDECFDLLLTDLGMPDLSGRQVALEARALHPSLPVVLTTGWGETMTPENLAEMQASALLPKPFTNLELAAVLAKVLPVSG